MDFIDNIDLNVGGEPQRSEPETNNQVKADSGEIINNGPDDVNDDTLHQILDDVDNSRGDVGSDEIEAPNAIEFSNPVLPPMPEHDISHLSIEKDEYEVFLPREFWEKNIVTELPKYGLPDNTQPVDFFNYLIVNREKLTNPSHDDSSKMVIEKVTHVEKRKISWLSMGILALVVIVILFLLFKKVKKAPVTESWFQ